jgi:hypothetical protein
VLIYHPWQRAKVYSLPVLLSKSWSLERSKLSKPKSSFSIRQSSWGVRVRIRRLYDSVSPDVHQAWYSCSTQLSILLIIILFLWTRVCGRNSNFSATNNGMQQAATLLEYTRGTFLETAYSMKTWTRYCGLIGDFGFRKILKNSTIRRGNPDIYRWHSGPDADDTLKILAAGRMCNRKWTKFWSSLISIRALATISITDIGKASTEDTIPINGDTFYTPFRGSIQCARLEGLAGPDIQTLSVALGYQLPRGSEALVRFQIQTWHSTSRWDSGVWCKKWFWGGGIQDVGSRVILLLILLPWKKWTDFVDFFHQYCECLDTLVSSHQTLFSGEPWAGTRMVQHFWKTSLNCYPSVEWDTE